MKITIPSTRILSCGHTFEYHARVKHNTKKTNKNVTNHLTRSLE